MLVMILKTLIVIMLSLEITHGCGAGSHGQGPTETMDPGMFSTTEMVTTTISTSTTTAEEESNNTSTTTMSSNKNSTAIVPSNENSTSTMSSNESSTTMISSNENSTSTDSPGEKGSPTKESGYTVTSPEPTCLCGVWNRDKNQGEENESSAEFPPWQVQIVRKGSNVPICSGALLSSRTIVTAAECAQKDVKSLEVILGAKGLNADIKRYNVAGLLRHPNDNFDNPDDYGILLVTLNEDVVFDDELLPICLTSTPIQNENRTLVVTGYENVGDDTYIPQYMDVRTMSNEECTTEDKVYSSEYITDRFMCGYDSSNSSCIGIEGDPMVDQTSTGTFELVGVFKWRLGCKNETSPGVYARVSAMVGWIEQNLLGNVCLSDQDLPTQLSSQHHMSQAWNSGQPLYSSQNKFQPIVTSVLSFLLIFLIW